MDEHEVRDAVARLRASGLRADPAEVDAIWAAAATVDRSELLGSWSGSEIVTGHPGEGNLPRLSWYGKVFESVDVAHPIVCRRADGSLFSNTAVSKGEASLWNVEFRGEVTATMVYDGQPIFDHFKRVDDDVLIGIMNGKNAVVDGRYYSFLLVRDADQALAAA
jgi:hypothetical protein